MARQHLQTRPRIRILPRTREKHSGNETHRHHKRTRIQVQKQNKKIVNGNRYLGGPLGEEDFVKNYTENKLNDWKRDVEAFIPIASRVPHESYTAITKSLKHRWTFTQRATQVDPADCNELDDIITGPLLDALLRKQVSETSRNLSTLRVKQGGFGLPNLRTTATSQYKTSKKSTDHLNNAIKGREDFDSQQHSSTMNQARKEHQVRTVDNEKTVYHEIVKDLPEPRKRILERASQTGIWLSQYPSTYNGNLLSPVEFRDSALLRFRETPANLQPHCDGCSKRAGLDHLLTCKTGGLIHQAHDELRDKLALLTRQMFTPSTVQIEPPIYNRTDSTQDTYTQERGNIGIRGFWTKQVDSIVDIQITYLEANSHRNSTVEKVLEKQVKEEKYPQPCLERRRHFTPFITTTTVSYTHLTLPTKA